MLRLKGLGSCEFDLNHMTFPTPLTHRRRHIQRRDHHVLYQRRQESKMSPQEEGWAAGRGEMAGGLRQFGAHVDMVSKVVHWPEVPGLSWCDIH